MDPRNAANFVPPSQSSERARFMSVSKIPDNGPIHRFMETHPQTPADVAAAIADSEDGPTSPRSSASAIAPEGSAVTEDAPSTGVESSAGSRAQSDDYGSSNFGSVSGANSTSTSYAGSGSTSSSNSGPNPAGARAAALGALGRAEVSRSASASGDEVIQNIPAGIPRPPSGERRRFVVPEVREPAYLNAAELEEVPGDVRRQATHLEDYHFPDHRLATQLRDPTKSPLVLVSCGSFSPITYLHLRMFEMALDAVSDQTRFEVIGGYYSPVSDHYLKAGLAPAHHRVRMCELACERTSSWLMVDAWESLQPTYQRTAVVLDHFNYEINVKRRGVMCPNTKGGRRGVKIMLLAGGDLIESMGEPNVWMDEDLRHILGRYGCMIVERTGSDVRSFLLSHDIMYEHRHNVLVIKQLIYNDISSTQVRLFIRRNMSVQYLTPSSVIRYIYEHKLYLESEPVKSVLTGRGD